MTGMGMAITSGNTLTTVTAIAGIEDVMVRAGRDLAHARTAVVGASGSIGRLASLMLSRRVGTLTLVGNPSNPNSLRNCRSVAGEIYRTLLHGNPPASAPGSVGELARSVCEIASGVRDVPDPASDEHTDLLELASAVEANFRESGLEPPIEFSVDPETALSEADVVLVATNSDTAIIRPHHLKKGAVVCDVARPPNVPDDVVDYRNMLVFDGGMVELPQPVAVGSIQGLSPGVAWGCLAETILLSLEGETVDHSIGQQLTLAEADHIAKLAKKHGFRPATTQWYGRNLAEEDFRRIGPGTRAGLRGDFASERVKDLAAA
jgi:predicted amino acid dehydrogenase